MTQTTASQIRRRALSLALLLCLAILALAQTATSPDARGVIRLKVKVKPVTAATGLSRKRFYLIKGSLADNGSLIENMKRQPVTSRDCYYRSIGASEALVAWLKQYDCESVYCREVDWKEVDAVPEFQRAVAAGEKEFGSRELARKWLTVNLSEEIRIGYYRKQQQELRTLIETSKATVMSVMTDRKGTGYFTDIEPGMYVISNIIRTEGSETASLWWNCEVKVEAGDISMVMDRPFQISNTRDMKPQMLKQTKCFSDEQPLPACPAR